jgi:ABC-2 type transport system permease protein
MMHLKSALIYRASFVLLTVAQFVLSFSMLLGINFLFSRFHSVAGFTYNEVLLNFAIVLSAFALAECFARGFDLFPQIIANGEFDRMLVRPRGLIFQVLASKMEFNRIGRLATAAIVFIIAIPASGVLWTADKIIALILMLLCGALVFSALFVVGASFAFFTLQGLEFMNILTDGGREFGSYPYSIYGKTVLKFLTFVVPLALFQYYPLTYILGRTENIFYMLCPLISLLFLLPAYTFWRFGLRHYVSTGS